MSEQQFLCEDFAEIKKRALEVLYEDSGVDRATSEELDAMLEVYGLEPRGGYSDASVRDRIKAAIRLRHGYT